MSPDASRIAITQREGGSKTDIWIFEIATGQLTPMTRDGISAYPEWADAKHIVYREASTATGVFLSVPWDHGADPLVFHTPNPLGRGGNSAFNLSLGPRGKYLTVMRQRTGGAGGNRQDLSIHSMVHPDSGNILVGTKASEMSPRVSPNGRWVACTSDESGTFQLSVLLLPGPGLRVPVAVARGIKPVRSHDGKLPYDVSRNLFLAAHLDEGSGFTAVEHDTLFNVEERGFALHPPYGGPVRRSSSPNSTSTVQPSGANSPCISERALRSA